MNYQDELTKMKPAQLKLMLDTIREAGIASEIGGDWKSVFRSAKNKTNSPRVKSLIDAFINLQDVGSAIDAFLNEVKPNFEKNNKSGLDIAIRSFLSVQPNEDSIIESRKETIYLSPLLITEVDAIAVRFKEPLELTPCLDEESQQYLVVEEPTLAINAFALNREQLFDEVQEQLVMLWREYASAEDSELTTEARRLKSVLLSKMEYCNAQA